MKIRAGVLWWTVARTADGGHATRDYVLYSADGETLGAARAHPWRRAILVQLQPSAGMGGFEIRRRRAFPLTGRVDVFDTGTARLVGALGRNGRYRDDRGRPAGAFRDARTLSARTRESVLAGVLDALVNSDGSQISGPAGFVHLIDGHPAGTLVRAKPPFLERTGEHGMPGSGRLGRLTPARLRKALFAPPVPVGWRLETDLARVPDAEDPRLRVAAAVFAVELSHW